MILHVVTKGFPSGSELKNLLGMQERKETQVGSLGGEEPPGKGHRQLTPVFLPGGSYGQRSLAGYSPWGRIELDMTKATEHTHASCQQAYFTAADNNISSVNLSLLRLPNFCVSCFCCCSVNSVRLFATPWTETCQAPLSVGFLRQEYWSGLPFPSPEDFPGPGIQSVAPALACRFFTMEHERDDPRRKYEIYSKHLKTMFLSILVNICTEPIA